MERTRAFQVASLLVMTSLLVGAPALAQTPVPGQAIPCSPLCGPGEMCVQGQCLVPAPPQETNAPPPPVEPAPAPVTAPPLPEPEVAPPPPPRARRKKAHPEPQETAVEEDDEVPSWRRGVLILPFAGVHSVQGIAADDFDAGPRFGALIGVHASPVLSLNVELAMDILSPKVVPDPNLPRGLDVSGRDFTIAFSPLFHASSGIGEFVVGPKLGFWSSGIELKTPGFNTEQLSQTGWAFGFNMGAFAGVTDAAAIGALLSYQMTYLSQSCFRSDAALSNDCQSGGFVPQILSFSLAAIF